MNISQLEYLVETIDQGSYANAAKQLFVTPQAVSKGISDLEKELGIKLFIKSGRGIEPTAFGSIIASKAREIIECCMDLRVFAKSLAREQASKQLAGNLNIAVASSAYEGGVIDRSFFSSFSVDFPEISLNISNCSNGACFSALYEGIIDAAIVLGNTSMEGFSCTKIFDSSMRVAMSNTHPLAKKTRSPWLIFPDFRLQSPLIFAPASLDCTICLTSII